MSFSDKSITVGARSSLLSKVQVQEVLHELKSFHPTLVFEITFLETTGDKDRKTSLRGMEKSDFFTKEIDEMQIDGRFQISIHSAKDLPQPIREGLEVVALTKGVDPSDVLVTKKGVSLASLQRNCKIGTSCKRRDEAIHQILPQASIVDIRGTIQERLSLVDQGKLDGVVMAKAALIRLQIKDVEMIPLEGKVAPLQGKLAVVARKEDEEMKNLFSCIDTR